MHFSTFLVGAFAAVAFADIKFTKAPTSGITAGTSYTLKWESDDDTTPVTITLREGNARDLTTISTITNSGTGGSFVWNVPSTIADASDYTLQITQGTQTNYWQQFAVSGGSGTLSTSGTASSSATSTGSSASSRASSARSSASSSSSASSASSASSTSSAASSSSSATSSSSSASSTSSSSASATQQSAGAPSSTGNAADNLKSNAAFVVGAAAALAYLA